jgi:hypothetical protein
MMIFMQQLSAWIQLSLARSSMGPVAAVQSLKNPAAGCSVPTSGKAKDPPKRDFSS